MAIWLYAAGETDFTTNGLGQLWPSECLVKEIANGMYELQLNHPIDQMEDAQMEKWRRIKRGCILSVPVPTRTLPEIVNSAGSPSIVSTFEIWETTRDKTVVYQKDSDKSKKLRKLKADQNWTVTLKQGTWFKGRDDSGRSGWIQASDLKYKETRTTAPNTSAIETVVPASFSSQQLFRVYRPAWTIRGLTVHARHITYDFGRNLVNKCTINFIDGFTALNQMMNNLVVSASDFEVFTDITTVGSAGIKPSIDWSLMDPVEALLRPDDGFCDLYDADAVRDNFSIYLLKEAGLDRGFTIAYGKNMKGLTWDENDEDVVTRIVPVGEDENGEPLRLPELYVDSAHIGDYPFVSVMDLNVSDAKVGSTNESGQKITAAMAYAMMRNAAREEFNKGRDRPVITLKVDFVNLGDTQEFAWAKALQNVYTHDVIHIRHDRLGMTFKANVTQTNWDAVRKRYMGIEIATEKVKMTSVVGAISGWQLLQTTLNGLVLRPGTVTSRALATGAITGTVLGTATITSKNISASGVTNSNIGDETISQAKIAGLSVRLASIEARLAALEKK